MREIDAHFDAYEHLKHLPREAEALHTLRKVASLVKPIMRKRGWKIGILCEFFPPEPRLLGLNINQTERICLRLRHAADQKQFLPIEEVVDTLLHELSHVVYGPHDQKFMALWNELRAEHESLVRKGYTGEGFLSAGHKLGGRRIPLDEMRRQARAAAEKRRVLTAGSGQKLGGAPVLRGTDMRQVIADAAARRTAITQGCASGMKEAGKMAERAAKNGFRTKAEEDDANDLAIANALIELMEEEEGRKLDGVASATADEGLTWTAKGGLELAQPTSQRNGQSQARPPPASEPKRPVDRNGRPVSRLVLEAEARKQPRQQTASRSSGTPTSSFTADAQASSNRDVWTCPVCTLENPHNFLCCDACGVERTSPSVAATSRNNQQAVNRSTYAPQAKPAKPLGWNCGRCGAFMETQWWTCSACGTMKSSS